MQASEVKEMFGVNPQEIGNRYRYFWIVEKIESEEEEAGASVGDLCVKTRDGSANPKDKSVYKISNFVGAAEDDFDPTYLYYYFKPLEK